MITHLKRVATAAVLFLAMANFVQAEVIEAGNTTCPIGQEAVSGKNFVEYNGVKYGLCCQGCEKKFLKDPETYIAQMQTEGSEVSHEGAMEEEHAH